MPPSKVKGKPRFGMGGNTRSIPGLSATQKRAAVFLVRTASSSELFATSQPPIATAMFNPGHRPALPTAPGSPPSGGGLMGTTLPTGETASGAGVNMGLGYFPLHWLGFLLHCQFGGATLDGRDVLDTRLGLEANAFPLAVGRLHIGGYGQIGHAWLEADAPDGSGAALTRDAWSAGVGGLLELALTTRLAIVGRLGETFDAAIDGRTPHNLVGMLGFSVY